MDYYEGRPVGSPPGRNRIPALPALLPFPGIIFLLIASSSYPMLRNAEALVILAACSAPFWIPFALLAGSVSVRKTRPNISTVLWSMVLCAFGIGCIFDGISVILNAKLDRSPEITVTVPVTNFYVTHSKNGTPLYHAAVKSPIGHRLSIPLGSDYETITVTKRVYDSLDLSSSKFRLVYKPGVLRLPWRVSLQPTDLNPPQSGVDGYVSAQIEAQEKAGSGIVPFRKPEQLSPSEAVDAYYQLGWHFSDGSKPPNYPVAIEWLKRAAEAGSAEAQYQLGYMYSTGEGVAKDDAAAAQWFGQAAANGMAAAQDYLGVIYGDGRGVAQDWVKSYMWLSLAAGQGLDQGKQDLPMAASHLTQDQKDEALREAADIKAKTRK